MRIALAQMSMGTAIADNVDTSVALITQAADRHADMIVFPEI